MLFNLPEEASCPVCQEILRDLLVSLDIGEFQYPLSVALLSNGQIAVSDVWNFRIQIFD